MKRSLIIAISIYCATTWAESVWHCSRNIPERPEKEIIVQNQDDQFSIASLNSSTDVIGVSINDLIDIYSGVPVKVGGLPLSACFMPSNQALTSAALTSLGLQPTVIQALGRKNAIIQTNIFFVTTETQMLTCINQHFPAVGYLKEATLTKEVHPCF